ncbi:hypothetical protein EI94DRAFT_1709554 [Lactarius quietus]|nr:hypothetical protein EI94DRAFT_1709554 [Lactarius quietus]
MPDSVQMTSKCNYGSKSRPWHSIYTPPVPPIPPVPPRGVGTALLWDCWGPGSLGEYPDVLTLWKSWDEGMRARRIWSQYQFFTRRIEENIAHGGTALQAIRDLDDQRGSRSLPQLHRELQPKGRKKKAPAAPNATAAAGPGSTGDGQSRVGGSPPPGEVSCTYPILPPYAMIVRCPRMVRSSHEAVAANLTEPLVDPTAKREWPQQQQRQRWAANVLSMSSERRRPFETVAQWKATKREREERDEGAMRLQRLRGTNESSLAAAASLTQPRINGFERGIEEGGRDRAAWGRGIADGAHHVVTALCPGTSLAEGPWQGSLHGEGSWQLQGSIRSSFAAATSPTQLVIDPVTPDRQRRRLATLPPPGRPSRRLGEATKKPRARVTGHAAAQVARSTSQAQRDRVGVSKRGWASRRVKPAARKREDSITRHASGDEGTLHPRGVTRDPRHRSRAGSGGETCGVHQRGRNAPKEGLRGGRVGVQGKGRQAVGRVWAAAQGGGQRRAHKQWGEKRAPAVGERSAGRRAGQGMQAVGREAVTGDESIRTATRHASHIRPQEGPGGGQGRAGQGRAGQGRAGQGRAGGVRQERKRAPKGGALHVHRRGCARPRQKARRHASRVMPNEGPSGGQGGGQGRAGRARQREEPRTRTGEVVRAPGKGDTSRGPRRGGARREARRAGQATAAGESRARQRGEPCKRAGEVVGEPGKVERLPAKKP